MDNDILNTEETYRPDDFNASSFELIDEGEQHLQVVDIEGEMHQFQDYHGPRARIRCALIEDGKPSETKTLLVFLTLPHTNAKPGTRKQRALILSRLGFITKGDSETEAKFNWKDLLGVEFLGDVEHSTYQKDGKDRVSANLKFDGWNPLPADMPKTAAEGAGGEFSDI